ncbi:sugar transporter [Pontibacter korlensis]|uniref:Sugar transporter n=1 Tax=Pontibacter korlensis TaxID=400092 RepID=A0A0E3ZHA2_9BACT|nr:polysaccharide biosynthesis/export family protein [Pontibacter korlensis]AKD03973.1 sugar transporter [Pontibacter korlensis]
MILRTVAIFSLIMLGACSQRNLVYLSDLKEQNNSLDSLIDRKDPVIQVDDRLGITVNSLSPEHNAVFSNGLVQTGGQTINATASTMSEGYVVDKNGAVNFLVLGKIQLAGLTKEEATNKLTGILKDYIKEPVVSIRYLNFKVTVLGEVNNPSTFAVPTEKVNIMEALGYAGDMTIFGKRENVLVIREVDGVRSVGRMNLNSKDIFDSPYYYLQQNDIVYVEPVKAKAAQSNMTRTNVSFILSVVSVLALVGSRIL